MKYRYAVIFFIAAFILQTSIFGQFTIFGASCNLILCSSVVLSFIYTDNCSGLIAGSAAALLYDITFSPYMAMTALPLAVTVGICLFIREFILNREKFVSMVIVAVSSTIIYYHLYFVMMIISDIAVSYIYFLGKLAVYIILNVIVMIIMYVSMIGNATSNRNKGYTKWAGF